MPLPDLGWVEEERGGKAWKVSREGWFRRPIARICPGRGEKVKKKRKSLKNTRIDWIEKYYNMRLVGPKKKKKKRKKKKKKTKGKKKKKKAQNASRAKNSQSSEALGTGLKSFLN